jgi:hypothetical protein
VQDVSLASDEVETQSLASIGGGTKPIRYLYQDAELFFFAVGDTVYGVQFGKALNPDPLVTADDGQQVLGIDGGTSDWYWAEGSYDQTTGRVPCQYTGGVNWHLVPSNPNWMIAPSFEYTRVRFCSAAPPMFAMDGDNIAVAVEAPRDGHPQAWEIRLMSTFNGSVLRSVETDRDLLSLDLSGEDIAYVEGDYNVNIDPNYAFNTQLMLSSMAHPESVEVAKDAYGVSFSGGRLAWTSDPQLSERDDSAPASALITASAADLAPRVLATDQAAAGPTPVADGNYVTWSASGQVFLWNAEANATWQIRGTGDAGQPSDRGGWLTWVSDDTNGVQSLNAVDLNLLFPPPPTPSPKPTPPATPFPSASLAQPDTININGIEWKRFEHDALPKLMFVGDVTQAGGRFLMVGSRCAYPLPDYAGGCGTSDVLMSSTDGATWTELGTVGGTPGDDASNFYEDVRGWFASGSHGYDNPVPGVWHSVDNGLNWDFNPNPWPNPGQCTSTYGPDLGQIYADGADLIAIGSGIWRSSDGLAWTCVGPIPRIVITYAHGTYVGEGSGSVDSAADTFWQSDNGIDWHKTQKAPLNTSLVPVAEGFVGIGGGDRYAPPTSLLTSTDGRSWMQQPYPFGTADVELVPFNGDRALVIETDYSTIPGEIEPGAVWVSSTDGTTWTRYELPPRDGDNAQSAALIGNELVVTGSSYNNGNSDGSGVIWSTQVP